jgi:hypothetical protein
VLAKNIFILYKGLKLLFLMLKRLLGRNQCLFCSVQLCLPDFSDQYTEEMGKSFPFKKKTDAIKQLMATYPTVSKLKFLAPPPLNQKESYSSGVTAASFAFFPFFQLGDLGGNDLFFAFKAFILNSLS